jgi:hypothetical protein
MVYACVIAVDAVSRVASTATAASACVLVLCLRVTVTLLHSRLLMVLPHLQLSLVLYLDLA